MGNGARNVRLGSLCGAWCTECNGTMFVRVSQILMKWGRYFVCHDNIWQTLVGMLYTHCTTPILSHHWLWTLHNNMMGIFLYAYCLKWTFSYINSTIPHCKISTSLYSRVSEYRLCQLIVRITFLTTCVLHLLYDFRTSSMIPNFEVKIFSDILICHFKVGSKITVSIPHRECLSHSIKQSVWMWSLCRS